MFLLKHLKESGVGCYIGHVFVGALAYADDIILLTPTRTSMEKLINICEQFSEEFSILFNGTKSKHIFFSMDNVQTEIQFKMQGCIIPKVPCEKHLGNLIGINSFNQAIDNSVNTKYKIQKHQSTNVSVLTNKCGCQI